MDKNISGHGVNNHNEISMSFWKKNSKTVPGRPSPHKESSWSKVKGSGGNSSFQEFQDSVRDAWEIEDDDFVIMSSDVKISKKVAQSTALSVINSHRTGSASSPNRSGSVHPEVHEATGSSPNKSFSCDPIYGFNNHTEGISSDEFFDSPPSLTCNPEILELQHPHALRNQGSKCIFRNESERERGKAEKIRVLLEGPGGTDLKELQSLSYSGLPFSIRGTAWKLLAGYLPTNSDRRKQVLDRKREEYWSCVEHYYDSRLEESNQDTFRQIHIDIPRMCPLIALFQQTVVQEMFERILFIWAIRHPASGYVQGMNDLVTPFFVVFLEEVLPPDVEVESFEVSKLPQELRNNIEADSYWCMSKFLDSIQVNYIFAQTGIQEKVKKLKELIERIDLVLHNHLQKHEIDYLQFSFRWMNNLLMRELPLRCTIRLWDTYLAEPDGCGSVLLYVCAAFLRHWREQLMKQRDFQGLMLLLQNLPTHNWDSADISLIVAEAYRLKYMFDSAPKHLKSGSN